MRQYNDLPSELKLKIFTYCLTETNPRLICCLKLTCREFYCFYNLLFGDKLLKEFGTEYIEMINFSSGILENFIKPYIKSFEYWRGIQRSMIANFLQLSQHDLYHKDSLQLIYSILKNKRLFATYEDYKIDEPSTYRYNNGRDDFVRVNKTYLLSYKKTIELTPDTYNLACGIIVENVLGLSTTKFQVLDHETQTSLLEYYPPSNINDILPKSKFVLLNLGDFKVTSTSGPGIPGPGGIRREGTEAERKKKKLVKCDVIMEETGLYIKSGFSICFIDFNVIQPNHTEHVLQLKQPHQLPQPPALTPLNDPTTSSTTTLNTMSNGDIPPPPRRRSSISLNSSLLPVLAEDFNFHNFLLWYVENDITPPFKQRLCNIMLKNIYKALELMELGGSAVDIRDEVFDLSPYRDIETYNHHFYSRFCIDKPQEKIKRVFKFLTVIQQRNYDMEVAKSTQEYALRKAIGLVAIGDEASIQENYSPLKWKMQTILEL